MNILIKNLKLKDGLILKESWQIMSQDGVSHICLDIKVPFQKLQRKMNKTLTKL